MHVEISGCWSGEKPKARRYSHPAVLRDQSRSAMAMGDEHAAARPRFVASGARARRERRAGARRWDRRASVPPRSCGAGRPREARRRGQGCAGSNLPSATPIGVTTAAPAAVNNATVRSKAAVRSSRNKAAVRSSRSTRDSRSRNRAHTRNHIRNTDTRNRAVQTHFR